jgi:hypothetical protein
VKRRLLTLLSAFSALLCTATVISLVSSYTSHHHFQFRSRQSPVWYTIGAEGGRAFVNVVREFDWPDTSNWSYEQQLQWRQQMLSLNDQHIDWKGYGFAIRWGPFVHGFPTPTGWVPHKGMSGTVHLLAGPHWFLILLTLILPAHWLHLHARLRRTLRRLRLGLCPTCGYDLRASKNKCPECGSAIPTDSKQQMASDPRCP